MHVHQPRRRCLMRLLAGGRSIQCHALTQRVSAFVNILCNMLIGAMYMEDPIVIPTARSVQLTLQKNSQKTELQVRKPVVVAKDVVSIADGGNGNLGSGSNGAQALKPSQLQAEVNQKIADWQNELSRQSNLLSTLEELLKADLEALQAGKPPPEDNEDQRKVLSTLSPKVTV